MSNTLTLEAAIISAMVCTPEQALPIVFETEVDDTLFTSQIWKLLFNSVIRLYRENNIFPDAMLVYDDCAADPNFDDIKFAQISEDVMSITNLRATIIKVKKKTYDGKVREAYAVLKWISATTPEDELGERLQEHRQLLRDAEHFNPETIDDTEDVFEQLKFEAEAVLTGVEVEPVIDMSFIDGFNDKFTAIERQEYWTIAARTSVGKSSFVAQIVMNNLKDKKIIIHPLESNMKEFCRQVASQVARVNFRQLNIYPQERVTLFFRALDKLQALINKQIFFYKNRDLNKLTAYNDAHFLKHGRPDLIILDYIQLVQGGNKGDNRATRIGESTAAMKEWAGKYDCCVIALAQVGRGVDKDDRRPNMGDLKESGNIEQDSNRVTFLHMPLKNKAGSEQRHQQLREIELIQDKQRYGPAGRMEIKFHAPTTTFYREKPE